MTASPSTAAMLAAEELCPCSWLDGCRDYKVHRRDCTATLRPAVATALDAKERLIADKDAENARLRSALEPFAKRLTDWESKHGLSHDDMLSRDKWEMDVGFVHLRKARTALQTTEQTEKT